LSRFLSLALRPTAAAFAQIDPALEDAASIAGAGLLRRLARILAPQAAAAAAAGAGLVFINAANERTLSALLWSTGHETLGVTVFSLHSEG
ncbi:ABC transporter permease subunit, partial [Acinetobacter baumannii]